LDIQMVCLWGKQLVLLLAELRAGKQVEK
jgi:hypothetical protein